MENVEAQAPVEPVMPTVPNNTVETPEEVSEYEQPKPVEVESETPETDVSEERSETPSDDTKKTDETVTKAETEKEVVQEVDDPTQFDDIIEGWKEDRESLAVAQKENTELKQKLSRLEEKDTEEEYSEMSEEERIDSIVKKRETESLAQKEAEQKETQNEIRFYERTDKDFADNKAKILDIAVKFNAQNLSQAIMIWKGQQTFKAKSKAKPKPIQKETPVQPKADTPQKEELSSFGDMYRQGGIN